MGKSNKIISFLLCVLIVLSAANLFLGATNSYRIKQLESAPPVVIEKDTQLSYEEAEEITATEEITSTSAETTAETTEEITSTTETTTAETTAPQTEASASTTTTKPTTTEAVQNQSSDICYVTSSGTKYHRAGCSYLKKSKNQMTISEAKMCGYSPCSRCY